MSYTNNSVHNSGAASQFLRTSFFLHGVAKKSQDRIENP